MMIEYFSSLALPKCAMTVNGDYLERKVLGYRTTSVSGRDAMTAHINEQTTGDTALTRYLSKREETRDITVSFALTADDRNSHEKLFNKLKGLLNTGNSKFIFDDESDVYYIGTVSGVTSSYINSSGTDAIASKGEITIHCSDPYKYSTVQKVFSASFSDGVLLTTVVNSGTKAVPIDYTITHNHENGYVGIVSEHGVIQLGKTEEADGETYDNSELVTTSSHYKMWSSDSKWVDDKGTNGQNNDSTTQGSFGVVSAGGYDVLSLASTGLATAGKINGAMKTLTLPNASKNVYVYMNSWFETGLMGQTGAQTIAFLDANNKCICAQCIYKGDMSGNSAGVDFWIGGNSPKIAKHVNFEPSYSDGQNPYNENSGHSDMRKDGNKITFHWWGAYPSFVVPELADVKVAKIQIYLANYGDRGTGSRYVTRNYFRRIVVRSDVEHWRDVPNRYQLGDVIYVDGAASTVYVNGMYRAGDEVIGSRYFLAPPGETEIVFGYSSFCSVAPTITAQIREAWL